MSILTSRELEFLASLNTNWRRLYFTELARLLEEDERRCGADEESPKEGRRNGRGAHEREATMGKRDREREPQSQRRAACGNRGIMEQ